MSGVAVIQAYGQVVLLVETTRSGDLRTLRRRGWAESIPAMSPRETSNLLRSAPLRLPHSRSAPHLWRCRMCTRRHTTLKRNYIDGGLTRATESSRWII